MSEPRHTISRRTVEDMIRAAQRDGDPHEARWVRRWLEDNVAGAQQAGVPDAAERWQAFLDLMNEVRE